MALWLWILLGYLCNALALCFAIVMLDKVGRKRFVKVILVALLLIPWVLTGVFVVGIIGTGIFMIFYVGSKELILWWKEEE